MKELRILPELIDQDLVAIVAFHQSKSLKKAKRIIEEYEKIIELLEGNPRLCRKRKHEWRVYVFKEGTYSLYYREMEEHWLVSGMFHSARDPDWILAQLLIREVKDNQ